MANIRDVAKQAEVSVTTVSRVLNQHPYVTEEKRVAVERAMEELGYFQNINAIHLSTGETRLIGVVIPYINHSYFSTLLKGIADQALVQGYNLVFYQTNYMKEEEHKAFEALKQKQVDALLILSRASEWEAIESYQSFGSIVVCETASHETIPCVSVDHYEAFRFGMRYMVDQGHQKIGYCIGRRNGTNSKLREKAYCEELERIGQPFREEWIFNGCLTIEDGKRVVSEYAALNEKPSALLITSDQVAAGFMMEAQKQQIQIPNNVAILGFDNHPIAEALDLTTIHLPLHEVGVNLVEKVVKKDKTSTIYPFELVERGSV
ncbi:MULTISPECIES: LacI family DNA-binding transcriptional regulator [Pontibacillus]|uniref:LacI family DNA-binding transcriptional regulator n=1 Tax=Pontibacillus chungwhensis TaxID=265426 RepID=A0ABY8UYI3_9BACI|nr:MULTISPECIES: LacI family DNA-binding transcriptional regulator [Pontibacillus]MCD5325879.1 LacI family DNA-binding transcriptional regulator [Pontibacillus sp. HN14]WIF97589.1 LacI family DNA-binding transcriptional regulator [Pontibacillus chungwhensis]